MLLLSAKLDRDRAHDNARTREIDRVNRQPPTSQTFSHVQTHVHRAPKRSHGEHYTKARQPGSSCGVVPEYIEPR